MDITTANAILERVKYKPNCKSMTFMDSPNTVNFIHDIAVFRLVMHVEDSYGRKPPSDVVFFHNVYHLEYIKDEAGLMSLVRNFIGAWEFHERDEWLLLDGERPFDPHKT